MPTQPQVRCKTLQVNIKEAKGAQSWKKIPRLREILSDGAKDLIEMHACYRLTWVQLFWKLFFYLKKAHLFLSWYAGNLNTNNLWSQMILKGSSCILAILLCVQRRTWQKGKYSSCCNCTQPNTICFWIKYFEFEVVPCSRTLVTSSWPLVRVTQPDNYWLGMLNWSDVTWLTQDYRY